MLRVLPGGEGEQHVAVTDSEEMGVWQMEGKWARRMGEDGEDKMGELGEMFGLFAFFVFDSRFFCFPRRMGHAGMGRTRRRLGERFF